jgi:hypothetical protein
MTMRFAIRAQWLGPDGRQVGVADEVVAANAFDVLDCALPDNGDPAVYTSGKISIRLIPDEPMKEVSDAKS